MPIKRALEAIPSDKRYGAVLSLEAENYNSHQARLIFKKWVNDWQDEDVQSDAAVLAIVLGNQVLQRVELLTSVESKVQPRVVGFDMKSGTVVGQEIHLRRGRPSLPRPSRWLPRHPDGSELEGVSV